MAGVELATAYISILPELRGLRRGVNQEFRSIEGGSASLGSRSGKKMEQGFTSATKGRLGKGAYAGMGTQSAAAGKVAGGRFSGEFMSSLKGTLAGFGTTLAVGLTAKVFKDSISEAADLEQSVGGLEAVFKKSFGTMNKEAKNAALNLGISRNEYNELATTLGSTLKNKGLDGFEKKTQGLIKTGADLSAQFGGSTKDAVDALSSAMRGEMDPIERYGVTMNQAMLESEAYASGIIKRTKDTAGIKAAQNNAIVSQRKYNEAVKEHGKNSEEALSAESGMIRSQAALSKVMEGKKVQLTDQQKAQAALNLITKQSADSQGAFGRESNTLSNQTQKLNAQFSDIKATLGTYLLPYLTKGGTAVNKFLEEMRKGTGSGGKFVSVLKSIGSFLKDNRQILLSLAAAYVSIRIAIRAYTVATNLAKAATTAYNVVSKAGSVITSAWKAGTYSLAAAQRVHTAAMNGGTTAVKARTFAEKVGMGWAKTRLAVDRVKTAVTNSSTLATIRQTVAEKARTAATKAGIVATRVFNAVMAMNPLAKVVLILTAVGAGLVLLYKKNETFRNFVNAAWQSIQDKVRAFSEWFSTNVTPKLKAAWNAIGNGARNLWTNYISPAFTSVQAASKTTFGFFSTWVWPTVKRIFSAIGSTVMWLWNKVVKPYFGFMKAYWTVVFAFVRDWVWPIVKRIFGAIGSTVKWLWEKIVKPYFGFMKAYWTTVFAFVRDWVWPIVKRIFGAIGGAAKWLWNDYIKPYFGFIVGKIKSVVGWIKDRGWPGIKSAFTSIASKASWLWEKVKVPFDAIKKGVGAVKDAIVKARNGIRDAWSKLNGYLRAPIKKAITWMNDKMIGGLNNLLGTKILNIPKTWRIPRIPGFDKGGWTGPGSKMTPAGVVHADEFVVKKTSRNKFERENPGTLDHINRFGRLPGYSIGGKVNGLNKKFLEQLSAFNSAAGGRYSVNSGYRSNAHQQILYNRYLSGNGPVAARPGSSQHNKGLAADLAPSNARDVHAALARKFGLIFTVPSESWHVEPSWARSGGGGGGGGGFFGGLSLPSWLENPAKWVADKVGGITKGFKSGEYGIAGQALPAIFSKLKSSVTNKVKEAASSLLPDFGQGGGGSFNFQNVKNAANQVMGRSLAAQAGWSGSQWNALKELWNRESTWNHMAKNPSSGAYGIPQALPGTKMASAGSDWRTNAQTQIKWGLNYIRERYGNPAAALAFHNRKNWYHAGGLVGQRALEFDAGGYLPTGRTVVENNTGKPEPLKRMDLEEESGGTTIVYVQNPWTGEYHEAKMEEKIQQNDAFNASLGRWRNG